MAIVLRFPRRHGRASAGSGIAAKASNVISPDLSFSPASRTKAAQRSAGMPRERQVLTVLFGAPKAAATAPVPPKASMTELGVNGEIGTKGESINPHIVRSLRTSQEFANRETTFLWDCGPIGLMIDPPEVIAPRLKALRIALGYRTQAAFAKRLGIEKNTYNPFEKAQRPLTFEVACTIRKLWAVPLDWLFYGADADRLPAHIYEKLQQVA